jgi:hypothetical protein
VYPTRVEITPSRLRSSSCAPQKDLQPGSARSVEISGLPYGTESNPPGWDPERGTVVAYDAGNAVVRAWRVQADELEPLWRRDGPAHAGHLIIYPDTRELVVGDWRDAKFLRRPLVRRVGRALGPVLGCLSNSRGRSSLHRRSTSDAGPRLGRRQGSGGGSLADTGVSVSCPGFGRDIYYQSLTTIARVVVA